MLYLMLQKSDDMYLAKVGYTGAGISTRRRAYKTHNPLAIMRSSCAGPVSMESSCHYAMQKAGGYRINGTEWYVISKEFFDKLYEKGMGYFRPNHKPIHFLEVFL
jgi:hypothetical protein